MRLYRKRRREAMRYVRIPLHVTEVDALIRIGRLKEDSRTDAEVLQAAVLSLLYQALGESEIGRERTHAAVPETSSGGDAVRPHPVTRNGSRRAYSHRSFEGGLADRCRSASGCGFEPPLSGIRRK